MDAQQFHCTSSVIKDWTLVPRPVLTGLMWARLGSLGTGHIQGLIEGQLTGTAEDQVPDSLGCRIRKAGLLPSLWQELTSCLYRTFRVWELKIICVLCFSTLPKASSALAQCLGL